MDDNYPPFVFREDSGELAGLLVDQWKLWQARTGIAVRIEAMDWIDAQLKMSSGAADVIDTIFRTVEREKLYDFTAPYADIEAQIFFNRELGGFGSIEALRGFTIGVKAGDASIDFLRSRGINSLQLFNNYETMVMAAVRGDLLVFCVDKPPALYYLYKLGRKKNSGRRSACIPDSSTERWPKAEASCSSWSKRASPASAGPSGKSSRRNGWAARSIPTIFCARFFSEPPRRPAWRSS